MWSSNRAVKPSCEGSVVKRPSSASTVGRRAATPTTAMPQQQLASCAAQLAPSASDSSSTALFEVLKRRNSSHYKVFDVIAKSAYASPPSASVYDQCTPDSVAVTTRTPTKPSCPPSASVTPVHPQQQQVATTLTHPTAVAPVAPCPLQLDPVASVVATQAEGKHTIRAAAQQRQQDTLPSSLGFSSRASANAIAQQFPAVGHYRCRGCQLPLFTASAKCRSLGGYPCFTRYFAPSMRMTLHLTSPFHVNKSGVKPLSKPSCCQYYPQSHFSAVCSQCSEILGYVPLDRVDLDDADNVHVLRVTSHVTYNGAKAPPEYVALETSLLVDGQEAMPLSKERDGGRGGAVALRRLSSHTASTALPGKGFAVASVQKNSKPEETDSDSNTSGDEEDDEDEEDECLWQDMRRKMRP